MSAKSAVSTRRIVQPQNLFAKSPEEIEEVEEVVVVKKEKRTFHLAPEVVLLLGELQIEQLRDTGKKPNLSDLVEEGVRLLAESRRQSV